MENDENLIEVEKLIYRPFTKFCMSIGAVPSSYLASMTIPEQILWLSSFVEKQVIPTVNNNAEAVEELQDLYVQLHDYVEHYFDNLDVQEEINNKLDAMAEAGYFQTLVDNYAEPILTDLTNQIDGLADQVEEATTDLDTKIEKLRKDNYNNYIQYNIPFTDSLFKNVQVYRSNEKQNIKVGYNLDNLKVTATKTYYVKPSGNNSSDGLSEANAWASVGYAMRNADTNSNIIILDGIYYRNQMPDSAQPIVRNFNIYGKDNVLLTAADNLSWTQDETYTNTYKTTRTNIHGKNIIDVRNWKQGIFAKLTEVESAALCNTTLNSFYYDSTNLYVNIGEEVTSDKIIAPLLNSSPCFNITTAADVYLENLTFVGGHLGCVTVVGSTLKMNKCTCLYGGQQTSAENVINIKGSKAVLIDTKANYGGKDGINYSLSNSTPSYGIEINCEASNNGLSSNDNTNNGSTAHSGSKIVRVNGNYFNNKGCNVADVHDNTESYNFNCNAFDSVSAEDSYSQDFSPQQSGATMHLINCYAKGSSYSNLYIPSGATMYVDNTEYTNKTGTGTFIEQ